jgi:hypothetical protein
MAASGPLRTFDTCLIFVLTFPFPAVRYIGEINGPPRVIMPRSKSILPG